MKVGDLVKYRGWSNTIALRSEPLALVMETRAEDSAYHMRIRVMWVGEEIPPQAAVLSTSRKGNRITTWVSPKHFEVVNEN